MIFQESETVELKAIVVQDIKKEFLCKTAIWFEMQLNRI